MEDVVTTLLGTQIRSSVFIEMLGEVFLTGANRGNGVPSRQATAKRTTFLNLKATLLSFLRLLLLNL